MQEQLLLLATATTYHETSIPDLHLSLVGGVLDLCYYYPH